MEMILSAISQGSLWAIMGFGVFLSFRVLKQADLTIESSFTLGAAVGVQSICFGVHPILSLLISFLAGMAAGALTGLLITKGNIQPLLAGIITMTGLYSVNLKYMGRANLSLSGEFTFKELLHVYSLGRNMDTLLLGLSLCLLIIYFLSYFFKTQMGQALIATGDNIHVARSLGIQTDEMKMLGMMLANGFVALSGNLVAQDNGYVDIGMGTGTVVIGLAAVIIGEALFKNVSLNKRMVTIVFGSIFYRLLLSFVLILKFDPNDFKLFSAFILSLCLIVPNLGRRKKG